MNKFVKGLLVLGSASLLAGCNTAHLQHSLKEVHKNIDTMIQNGVEMDIEVANLGSVEGVDEDFNGQIHVGALVDVFWAHYKENEVEEGMAFKVVEGGYNEYTYNAETDEYDFKDFLEESEQSNYVKEMLYFALGYANTIQGLLTDAGTTQVAGRDCHVYGFAFNNVLNFFGSEADLEICVDDETGITLKAAHDVYMTAAENTEFNFEVKTLVLEGVVAPTLNEPAEAPVEEVDA